MATYKEIQGFNIEVLSADPANPSIGEVWYNTTAGKLKVNTNTGVKVITTEAGGPA